jgi:polyferredoxin
MSTKIPVQQIDPANESSSKKGSESVDLYASRNKIYVKEIKGFFQRIRTFSLLALMGMYFLFAWLTLNGDPLIHFDLPAREFHLYGATFFPKDFFLLSGMLIISAFGLFFITTLLGRVWCGAQFPLKSRKENRQTRHLAAHCAGNGFDLRWLFLSNS